MLRHALTAADTHYRGFWGTKVTHNETPHENKRGRSFRTDP